MEQKVPENIKNIRFEDAVRSVFGVAVWEFKSEVELKAKLLPVLDEAFFKLCEAIRAKPIEHTRVNEIGNMLEPHVVAALMNSQIAAQSAKTKSGGGQATAYPDVSFEFEGKLFYLEVKSFAAKSAASKLRSFYMSPSNNPKVHQDAFHLVLGFEMQDLGATGAGRGGKALHAYIPNAFEVADLFGMLCDMKAEFNSNNVKMYEAERLLVKRRLPAIEE